MTLRSASITILLTTTFAVASVTASPLARRIVSKQRLPELQTAAPSGRVIVKFRDESRLGVTRDGVFSADKATAGRIAGLLESVAPGRTLRRRFQAQPEALDSLRAEAEARSGLDLPDLNTYGVLEPDTRDRDALLWIVARLLTDPAVETAYLEPLYVPASLGFDAFTGTYTPPFSRRMTTTTTLPPTPENHRTSLSCRATWTRRPMGSTPWRRPGCRAAGARM